jgi:ligand-binding sensor domain-containing protein
MRRHSLAVAFILFANNMKMNKTYFFVMPILFAIVIFSKVVIAQNDSAPEKTEPQIQVQRIAGLEGKHVVSLISEGTGGAWIGTEDEGVFHCDADNKISQFTTTNGLGDNNGYALAIDKLGRLWVGHLNMGLSVYTHCT